MRSSRRSVQGAIRKSPEDTRQDPALGLLLAAEPRPLDRVFGLSAKNLAAAVPARAVLARLGQLNAGSHRCVQHGLISVRDERLSCWQYCHSEHAGRDSLMSRFAAPAAIPCSLPDLGFASRGAPMLRLHYTTFVVLLLGCVASHPSLRRSKRQHRGGGERCGGRARALEEVAAIGANAGGFDQAGTAIMCMPWLIEGDGWPGR